MLGKVFERFTKKAPVAIMAQGILERTLSDDALNTLHENATEKQYTRNLLFSSIYNLMSLVVCKIQPGIHAAYQDNRDQIETSLTAVYDKLNRIDTTTSRALVKGTAEQMCRSMQEMKGTCTP